MAYCFDTSSFLDAAVRWYPRDIFPSFWEKLEELIGNGQIVTSGEVLRELERKDDEVFQWAKARPELFMPLSEDVQRATAKVLEKFPRLVDERSGKSRADPFVIGVAIVTGATLVTGEQARGSDKRPRIPDACQGFNVRCVGIVSVIREQGWKF